jgi:hypothetical protein
VGSGRNGGQWELNRTLFVLGGGVANINFVCATDGFDSSRILVQEDGIDIQDADGKVFGAMLLLLAFVLLSMNFFPKAQIQFELLRLNILALAFSNDLKNNFSLSNFSRKVISFFSN